jgi:hypothetical protein
LEQKRHGRHVVTEVEVEVEVEPGRLRTKAGQYGEKSKGGSNARERGEIPSRVSDFHARVAAAVSNVLDRWWSVSGDVSVLGSAAVSHAEARILRGFPEDLDENQFS